MLPDLYMQAIGQLWNEMILQQIISLQEYNECSYSYEVQHQASCINIELIL